MKTPKDLAIVNPNRRRRCDLISYGGNRLRREEKERLEELQTLQTLLRNNLNISISHGVDEKEIAEMNQKLEEIDHLVDVQMRALESFGPGTVPSDASSSDSEGCSSRSLPSSPIQERNQARDRVKEILLIKEEQETLLQVIDPIVVVRFSEWEAPGIGRESREQACQAWRGGGG